MAATRTDYIFVISNNDLTDPVSADTIKFIPNGANRRRGGWETAAS
jgi:hypothetical protein